MLNLDLTTDCLTQLLARRGLSEEDIAAHITRGRRVVAICGEIGLDDTGCQAALLQVAIPLDHKEQATVAKQLDTVIGEIVAGVQQMANASVFSKDRQSEVSDENLRKMLIAMVNDVRVVLVRLADQVDLMRNLKEASEEQRRHTARITLDVYSRLANRLGVWHLKWELEDYSLRYLEPDAYHQIAAELSEKRDARERYISDFIRTLEMRLGKVSVHGKVYGRPKHIYSIWKKKKSKGLAFENIMDIRAVRILVDSIEQCYTALGAVHTGWRHLPGEFDDYIATPKPNGYQSIHTAVIGPEEKVVEVQIRTHAMHEENEMGVAAHWRYKEQSGQDDSIDNKIQWLRQLLEWKDDVTGTAYVDGFEESLAEDSIYVFTPKGKVIDLPAGATPIDFAYSVHTEVGHKTRGVRINGQMVPLNTPLKTGDQIEIITVKTAQPSRDWIALPGYIHTHRARSRILHWFKVADRDQHIAAGRDVFERELPRAGLADLAYEKVASKNGFTSTDDMMASLGAGDISFPKLIGSFKRAIGGEREKDAGSLKKVRRPQPEKRDKSNFVVRGVGNLKTQMAGCCSPIPGEAIIGFITRGRGITIHQHDCSNMQNLPENDLKRVIDVEWGLKSDATYQVNIEVTAYNRPEILHDVTKVLKDARQEVSKAVLDTDEDESIVIVGLTLEVNSLSKLTRVLSQVGQVPNVLEVRRLGH